MAQTTRNDSWARSAMLVGACYFATLAGWTFVPALSSSSPLGQSPAAGVLSAAIALAIALGAIDPLRSPKVAGLGLAASIGVAATVLATMHELAAPRIAAAVALGVSFPFAAVLSGAWKQVRSEGAPLRGIRADVLSGYLEMATTQTGETVAELSREQTVMLVFLRHVGCTFCRETLSDLAANSAELQRRGVRPVVVHMSSEPGADEVLSHYGLGQIDRVRDPDLDLYRAFGLGRGSLLQLFGPQVWWRGMRAGVLDGHGIGGVDGDFLRMPGIFLVRDGEVVHRYLHRTAATRPDYAALAGCAERRC